LMVGTGVPRVSQNAREDLFAKRAFPKKRIFIELEASDRVVQADGKSVS
jgi:hypothetical protein